MAKHTMAAILIVGALLFASCGEPLDTDAGQVRGDEDHPLLEDLEDPPVNDPLKSPTPVEGGEPRPELPPEALQGVIVLLDRSSFSGVLEAAGLVEIAEEAISAETSEGTIDILFRLPGGMEPPRAGSGEGRVGIAEFSSATGADRVLAVEVEERLVFAEAWQVSAEPVRVELPKGLRIAQQPVDRVSAEYTEAGVSLEGFGDLPLGETIVIETDAGPVQVFLEMSHAIQDAYTEDDTYILHIWFAGAG